MIHLKKINEGSYEASLDTKTFESYGIDSSRLNEIESFAGVDDLITVIIEQINNDFGDDIGGDCGVGIIYEGALNRVIIRIVKGAVDSENFDPFEDTGISNGIFDENLSISKENYEMLENVVNEELNDSGFTKDYTNGIVLEFTNFEDVITNCNSLKKVLRHDEIVLLYSEPNSEVYYLVINKINKLINLYNEYEVFEEEADIQAELQYALSEEIVNEYVILNAYYTEKGLISGKTIHYLDEFAVKLMDKNVLKNITKIFK